jgi:hypothetical protein
VFFEGKYILVFLYVILFFIIGYSFIYTLIKAIKEEVSPHLTAILFLVWASLAIIVTANLMSLYLLFLFTIRCFSLRSKLSLRQLSVCRQKGFGIKKIRSLLKFPLNFRLKLTDWGSTSPLC